MYYCVMSDIKRLSTYHLFFTYSPKEFDLYLEKAKKEKDATIYTIKIQGYEAFYHRDSAIYEKLLEIEKLNGQLALSLSSLPDIAESEFIREALVDEVLKTNAIEGVFSTRKDIVRLFDDFENAKMNKISSTVNKYRLLLKQGFAPLTSLQDVRIQYDALMKGALAKSDALDGELFRKEQVHISDGIQSIHDGLYPEEKIQEAVNTVLQILNGNSYTIYERLFISHYLFEYAHPFYDGNGRMGRYLCSLYALKDLPPIMAFRIADAIDKRKDQYYKAFKETQDSRNRGDISTFVYPLLQITSENYQELIDEIEKKKSEAKEEEISIDSMDFGTSERKTLQTISIASVWGTCGIRAADIALRLNVTKRTIARHLSSLNKKELIAKKNIGRQTYYSINQKAK
jgi:Fic family protein